MHDQINSTANTILWVLFAASGLLFVIASSNVANLVLARTVRRESELAAGHAEVRLSGFITVSGRDPDDLRRACTEVLEHSARARLELHRMYGQQADAFTFTLPLCRGLK